MTAKAKAKKPGKIGRPRTRKPDLPTSTKSSPASLEGISAGRVLSTLEEAEAAVARLKLVAAAAERDGSHRERSAAYAALNASLKALAKARGEDQISDARIFKSQNWQRIADAIAEVLAKWPDAAEAVARRLRELGPTPIERSAP